MAGNIAKSRKNVSKPSRKSVSRSNGSAAIPAGLGEASRSAESDIELTRLSQRPDSPAFALFRSVPRAVWIIVAVGAAIRLFGAIRWGLWLDEVQIHKIIAGDFAGLFRNAHFAHFLAARPFVALADHNQLALRMPSLIFGCLSVPLAFLTARRLFNERVGLLFALFHAMAVYFIIYSVDANYYSHMMFWCLGALFCYSRANESHNPLQLLPIIPIALIAFFVHPFSAIFFGVVLLYLPLDLVLHDEYFHKYPALRRYTDTPRRRALTAAGILGVLLVTLVGLFVFAGWGSRALQTAERFIGMLEFGKSPTNVRFSYSFVESIFRRFGPAFLVEAGGDGGYRFITHLLFALFLAGGWLSGKRNRLLPVLIFLPFIISFGLLFNLDAKRAFSIRYFSYLAPVYWLGIAVAAEAGVSAALRRVPQFSSTQWAQGFRPYLLAGSVLLAFSLPQYFQMLFRDSGNWNKVMKTITPRVGPKEPFIYTNWPEDAIIPYYLKKYGFTSNPMTRLFYHTHRDKFTEAELKDLCYSTRSLWFVKSWSDPQSENAVAWVERNLEKVVHSANIFMSENDATLYHWEMGGRFVYPPRILAYTPSTARLKPGAKDFTESYLFDKTMDYEFRLIGLNADPGTVTLNLDESRQTLERIEDGANTGVRFRVRVEQGVHRLSIGSSAGPLGLKTLLIIPRYESDVVFIPACNASDIYPSLYTLTPKIDDEYVLRLVRNTFASYRLGLIDGGLYRIRVEGRRDGAEDALPVWIEVRFDGRLAGLLAFDNRGDEWVGKAFPFHLPGGDHLLTIRFVNERNLTRDAPETNRDAYVRSISLEPIKPEDPPLDERVFTPDDDPVPIKILTADEAEAWTLTKEEDFETRLLPAGGHNNAPHFTAEIPRESRGLLLTSPVMPVPASGILYHSSMLRAQNLENHSMNLQTMLYDAVGREIGLMLANQEGITGTTDWVRFVQVETLPDSVSHFKVVLWVYPNGRRPSPKDGTIQFSEPQLENTK